MNWTELSKNEEFLEFIDKLVEEVFNIDLKKIRIKLEAINEIHSDLEDEETDISLVKQRESLIQKISNTLLEIKQKEEKVFNQDIVEQLAQHQQYIKLIQSELYYLKDGKTLRRSNSSDGLFKYNKEKNLKKLQDSIKQQENVFKDLKKEIYKQEEETQQQLYLVQEKFVNLWHSLGNYNEQINDIDTRLKNLEKSPRKSKSFFNFN